MNMAIGGALMAPPNVRTEGRRVMSRDVIPAERIENNILLLRGQKVMLDRDLAALYEVETRVLNQAVIGYAVQADRRTSP